MFKKLLISLAVLVLSFGVTLRFTAPALSGALEDRLSSTYFTILLQNYVTAALPSTNSRGQLAYNSSHGAPTYNNGSGWLSLMSQSTHIQVTQGTAPTVSSCGSGAVSSTSSDSAGTISQVGSSCILTFTTNYPTNSPVVLATSNGGNAPRAIGLTTGIEFYGLTAGSIVNYATIGRF